MFEEEEEEQKDTSMMVDMEALKKHTLTQRMERRKRKAPSPEQKRVRKMSWTPDMDSCLTELMVEQVHRGRKIDHNFKKEAFAEVSEEFEKRTGIELHKDNIKNKLKTWRRQYLHVKELLNHSGFGWDDSLKKVFASHDVWKEYLKAHHEANYYRTKSVENYNELAIIFGNDQTEGMHSKTGAEVDLDMTDGLHSKTGGEVDVDITADDVCFEYDLQGTEPENSDKVCSPGEKKSKNLYWTPDMDACLTELMFEQAKRGRRVDNAFKSEVFAAVSEEFKKRTDIELQKDHIRNRMKTWRRQYRRAKELLNQSGFEWNYTLKKVVASDDVWKQYLKAHPEASFFRTKSVENFNELEVIFGNNQANGVHGKTGGEADAGITADDVSLACALVEVEGDNSNKVCATGQKKPKNLCWSPYMDACLTELMFEQAQKGRRVGNIIKLEVFTAISEEFQKRTGIELQPDHIRNRMRTWRRQYRRVKELLNQRGFLWNDTLKKVVASDDVWKAYLKDHPEASFYRTRSVDNFKELDVIIGKNQAGVVHSKTGAGVDLYLTAGEAEGDEFHDPSYNPEKEELQNNESEPSGFSSDGTDATSRQNGVQAESSSQQKQSGAKKTRIGNTMAGSLNDVAVALGKIAEVLSQGSSMARMKNLVAEMKKIPDLSRPLFLRACDYLAADEQKATLFLAMDEDIRREWLLLHLGSD
ncbi:uncharacterized protein LOC131243562 isoform X1 [Magnolia sinica]|nr:uncharacterized protein LOC131243562 isoform X1 [Magnolia sinica]